MEHPASLHNRRRPTEETAIAALVYGLFAIVLFWLVVPPVLALIFGIVGLRRINRSRGQRGGSRLAVAGIVLGTFSSAAMIWIDAGSASSRV